MLLKNAIEYLIFLILIATFIGLLLVIFYSVGFNTYLLFVLSILMTYILADTAGHFSSAKKRQPTTARPVSLEENKSELKEFVFRPLELKQKTYEELEAISKRVSKTPTETNESIIKELYATLKQEGEI